jgi:hypothetical protein
MRRGVAREMGLESAETVPLAKARTKAALGKAELASRRRNVLRLPMPVTWGAGRATRLIIPAKELITRTTRELGLPLLPLPPDRTLFAARVLDFDGSLQQLPS